jgi:hypothetical protein
LVDGHKLAEADFPIDGKKLRFRALPRPEYSALIDTHHPGPADREINAMWNRQTFPPALIAACSIGAITEDQARRMWAAWDAGTLSQMFEFCYRLNEDGISVPFTVPGTGITLGSGRNSTTAPRRHSPTPRSSPGQSKTRTKRSPGPKNRN